MPSILFFDPRDAAAAQREAPSYFVDLNLDQVVAALTTGRSDYDLAPFFHTPMHSVEAITYRHEVFRDLEDPTLSAHIAAFGERMRHMRDQLAQAEQLRHPYQREIWFLDAVETYCAAVAGLALDLRGAVPASRGMRSFRDYLADYAGSAHFAALTDETRQLKQRLAEVHYCLNINAGRVRVSAYDEQTDYGAEVVAVFEKFKQSEPGDHRVAFRSFVSTNHVEEAVVDRVALLFPDVFAELDAYGERHRGYLDPAVAAFDREAQFYLAFLAFTAPLKKAGLPFCCPEVSDRSKDLLGRDVFDIALADKLVHERTPVVPNDFHLTGPERVLVVSGPNQGGKTTFARTFGQLHHLAAIGCPVPGRQARLFLFDQLFTHFERGENLTDLSGKFQDDLVRVHAILEQATPASIVVMNEVFTSTTLNDAILLGTRTLERIIDQDLLCVCVTFVDELSSLGESTVSMVNIVVPGNPAERTFRVIRKPADGLSYALAIADKYRLTYERLKERIAS
ncbi:hypothetical protein [Streptomyces sp900116325]|uniref:MutS-related protein n=1 Tax=Streptomyces sp. 900116325 TaxID=3154295 RepID=UPI0033BB9869